MRIHIETFGCTANRADSLRMKHILSAHGHKITDAIDQADLVVVNTCTVTQTTQRKVMKFIRSLSKSGKDIIVAGCLPAAQPDTITDIHCHAITPASIEDIAGIIKGDDHEKEDLKFSMPRTEGISGIVSISQGCVGHCSYCIVKQARGELVSRSVHDIVQEIEWLVNGGAREILLTSQDTAAYGLDGGVRLPALLDAITSIEGDFMVRAGMMNPFTMLDILPQLIDSFQHPRIFKFLHIPVQSGSDAMLKHMNRGHTADEFRLIVREFRKRFPDITLSTDFIVGYPEETERDFNETLELLCEVQPQKVNITRFSPRPGTSAFHLNDMPDWKKKERSRVLTHHHHHITRTFFQNKIGDKVRILTTESGINCSTVGRDTSYNIVVIKETLPLGFRYDVQIIDSRTTYLIGERIT